MLNSNVFKASVTLKFESFALHGYMHLLNVLIFKILNTKRVGYEQHGWGVGDMAIDIEIRWFILFINIAKNFSYFRFYRNFFGQLKKFVFKTKTMILGVS